MEMVFKIGAVLRCSITVVNSVDEILPTLLYFMMLGSVIMSLFPYHPTITIGSCQIKLLVLQLTVDPLRDVD